MNMTITEAIGWATTALEQRARQWRNAAENEFNQDELFEADIDERLNMADMYDQALETLTTFGIVGMSVDEQGTIRIINIRRIRATEEQRP